ncbi:MAG: exported protein [Ferruginibacter sp.]|nr:exported protein [Ferruginibacter sp.]
MKTKLFTPALVIIAAGFFSACSDNKTNSTSSTSTDTLSQVEQTKMSDTMSTTNTMAPSAVSEDFVAKAASGGMMEVELGRIAQKNAASKDVKDFGKMMETDHSKANAALKSAAATAGRMVPDSMSAEHRMHVQEMQAKTGAEFDKAYMSMMVDDHNKDIAEFETAAAGDKDAAIKDFAGKTLPTLKKHLDKAKMVNSKL